MKKYFVIGLIVCGIAMGGFANIQSARAFKQMCCQGAGGCGQPTGDSCPTGFTPVECFDCRTDIPNDTVKPHDTTGTTPAPAKSTSFKNPLEFDTIEGVVGALLENLAKIIASIAVLFIVIGGLMYMLAFGDDKKITAAKSIITSAVIGFAIAISAGTFLKEIRKILGLNNGSGNEQVDSALSLQQIVTNTLQLLLSIVGIIAMIGLVVGGFFYLTAYGDEERAKKGKSIITSSIIGIAIALAALMIVSQVSKLLA